MNQSFWCPLILDSSFITQVGVGSFWGLSEVHFPGLDIKMMENLQPDGQNVASSSIS